MVKLTHKRKYYRKTKNKTKNKSKTYRKKGGGIIGKGISGTVHYPALQCKIPSETPVGEYVSKLSKKQSAENEFSITAKLRDLPDSNLYAIYPEYMCEYDDKYNLLFSKFGGECLGSFYENIQTLLHAKKINKKDFDVKYFENIIAALKELKLNVKYLNENKIYHGDLSLNNMLYDEKHNKIYLIDFEKGGREEDETEGIEDIIYDLEIYKKRILSKIINA